MSGESVHDSMSGGLAQMDEEHEAQLRLLDAFENAVRRGLDEQVLEGLLQQFIDHTNVHFLSEQLLMRLHAYEAYESHLQEHNELLAEVRKLQASFALGGGASTEGLIAALRRWLNVHIHTTDSVLGEYLSSRRGSLPVREEVKP
jgi:hemerythrin